VKELLPQLNEVQPCPFTGDIGMIPGTDVGKYSLCYRLKKIIIQFSSLFMYELNSTARSQLQSDNNKSASRSMRWGSGVKLVGTLDLHFPAFCAENEIRTKSYLTSLFSVGRTPLCVVVLFELLSV
jgi:hypothetical protein